MENDRWYLTSFSVFPFSICACKYLSVATTVPSQPIDITAGSEGGGGAVGHGGGELADSL